MGKRFGWIFSLLCIIFVAGLYVDGYAHNHFAERIESFFTPWHAIFYGGFLLAAGSLAILAWLNRSKGWKNALPQEYRISALGAIVFLVGGVGDMLWHIIFGIESSVEALFSPTHLLLAVGGVLLVSGPLRGLWTKNTYSGFIDELPSNLSLAMLLCIITFMLQVHHPFTDTFMHQEMSGSAELGQKLGLAAIMLQSAVLAGVMFVRMKQKIFPFGSFTLILTLNATAMAVLDDHYEFIITALIAGLLIDALYLWLKPTALRRVQLRTFGFLLPVVLYAAYCMTLFLTGGIWWSVHLWTGSIAVAGFIGYGMTYVLLPPISVSKLSEHS